MSSMAASSRPPGDDPTVSLSMSKVIRNKQVPSDKDWAYGWVPLRTRLSGVVKHISKGGAISVAHIRGDHRTGENFLSSDIVGLDFDQGDMSVEKCMADPFIAKHAFYVYATANSTKEHPRSRALFRLDSTVTDAAEYASIVNALLSKYDLKADQQCKDPVRIFFGSTKMDKSVQLDNVLPLSVVRSIKVSHPPTGPDSGSRQAASDLARLLAEGSQRGARDNDALKLVGALANVNSPEVVEAVMRMWYDTKILDKEDFPFSKIQDMIGRVAKKTASTRAEVSNIVRGRSFAPPTSTPTIMSALDFMDQTDVDITWSVDGWLPEHSTGLMIAPPGCYKTWLAMGLGLSIATGLPFGEKFPVKQGRVLFIQQEDSKYILRQRMKTIVAELCTQFMQSIPPSELKNPNLFTFMTNPAFDMFVNDQTLRLDNPNAMDGLRKLVEANKYDLVVLDPLYATVDVDDYMAKGAQQLVELKRMRDAFGTSFLVLHHTKKTSAVTGIDRQDLWGSQLLNAWLETGIQLRKTDDAQTVRALRHFKSSGETQAEILHFDISTDPDNRHFKFLSSELEAKVGDGEVDLISLVRQYGPIKTNQIAEKAGVHPSTISRRLAQLEKNGMVIRHSDKSYTLAGGDISF